MEFSGVIGPNIFKWRISDLAGTDEIFHLGLHCLIKYLFIGIQSEEG